VHEKGGLLFAVLSVYHPLPQNLELPPAPMVAPPLAKRGSKQITLTISGEWAGGNSRFGGRGMVNRQHCK